MGATDDEVGANDDDRRASARSTRGNRTRDRSVETDDGGEVDDTTVSITWDDHTNSSSSGVETAGGTDDAVNATTSNMTAQKHWREHHAPRSYNTSRAGGTDFGPDVDDEPARTAQPDPDDDWADWVDTQQLAARVRSLASAPRGAATGLVVPALLVASVAYRARRQAYARIP